MATALLLTGSGKWGGEGSAAKAPRANRISRVQSVRRFLMTPSGGKLIKNTMYPGPVADRNLRDSRAVAKIAAVENEGDDPSLLSRVSVSRRSPELRHGLSHRWHREDGCHNRGQGEQAQSRGGIDRKFGGHPQAGCRHEHRTQCEADRGPPLPEQAGEGSFGESASEEAFAVRKAVVSLRERKCRKPEAEC